MSADRGPQPLRIYKIVDRSDWDDAKRNGRFLGSADDKRDGYIHFSTAEQIAGTLAKHFAGQGNLVLVELDADVLGTALRWEPARDGALFPHLHGPLDMGAVLDETPLELCSDGRHRLPKGLDAC